MRLILLVFLFNFCLFLSETAAQDSSRERSRFYFYWGYNRGFFTQSDLQASGPDYEIVLRGVRAKDRPSPFSVPQYFGIQQIWVPQYNYRFGWRMRRNWVVSLGLDHLKYVVVDGQEVELTGVVTPKASEKWAGSYLHEKVKIDPTLLEFEHTDGLNLLAIDVEFQSKIARFGRKKRRFGLDWNSGGGGSLVIPRTDVKIFEDGLDNRFHLAGWSATLKTGPEFRLPLGFFVRAQARIGWIFLPDVLVANDAPERVRHDLGFFETFLVAGKWFGK